MLGTYEAFEVDIEAHVATVLAVTGAKQVMAFCEGKSVDDGLQYVALWNAAFMQSADLGEAMRAFAEKRKAIFTGQ